MLQFDRIISIYGQILSEVNQRSALDLCPDDTPKRHQQNTRFFPPLDLLTCHSPSVGLKSTCDNNESCDKTWCIVAGSDIQLPHLNIHNAIRTFALRYALSDTALISSTLTYFSVLPT